MKHWFLCTLLVTCITLGLSGAAHAEDGARVRARDHFKQGVQLFDERRFADALEQFERSFSLFPHYGTLYNMGQVEVALGHPVQAVEAFEKYLAQGGASVPVDQRLQVEVELKAQQQRIGHIKVAVNPDGTEIRVDGNTVGKAPMVSPVRVAAGHHRVEAMLEGYRTEQRELDVAGLGYAELQLKLEPLTPSAPVEALAPAGPGKPVATAPQSVTPIAAPPKLPATRPIPRLPRNSDTPEPGSRKYELPPPTESQPMPTPSSRGGTQRGFGYLLATVGLVGTGVGIALVADGQAKHSTALEQNKTNRALAEQTESASSKEKTQGFVVIGAGGALMLGGAVLLLTAPSGQSNRARTQLTPWIGVNGAGASVGGIF